jgi:hypothetical protein
MPVIVEGIGRAELGKSIGRWVQEHTIAVAEKALREEVGRGFDHEPTVVTDGVRQRDYSQVKPFGKIEFISRTEVADAVRWALTELQKRSPVLTGRYASSHTVMINGAEVKGNVWLALRRVKFGDRVQIVNVQPYARKIEGATASKRTGREKRRGSSRKARAGVYRPVQRAVVQRYGKAVYVDFKYLPLALGVKVWGKQGGGSGKRVQRDQVYPALQFFVAQNARA